MGGLGSGGKAAAPRTVPPHSPHYELGNAPFGSGWELMGVSAASSGLLFVLLSGDFCFLIVNTPFFDWRGQSTEKCVCISRQTVIQM